MIQDFIFYFHMDKGTGNLNFNLNSKFSWISTWCPCCLQSEGMQATFSWSMRLICAVYSWFIVYRINLWNQCNLVTLMKDIVIRSQKKTESSVQEVKQNFSCWKLACHEGNMISLVIELCSAEKKVGKCVN